MQQKTDPLRDRFFCGSEMLLLVGECVENGLQQCLVIDMEDENREGDAGCSQDQCDQNHDQQGAGIRLFGGVGLSGKCPDKQADQIDQRDDQQDKRTDPIGRGRPGAGPY